MDVNEEYHFKDWEYKNFAIYTVAKFNFRRYPEVVYEIRHSRFGWRCTCPAGRSSGKLVCKHIYMIQQWIKQGKPSPFDKFFDDTPLPPAPWEKKRKVRKST